MYSHIVLLAIKKCKKEEEEVIAIKKLIVQDISICNATIVEIIMKHQPEL